jgi:hypothetical protein
MDGLFQKRVYTPGTDGGSGTWSPGKWRAGTVKGLAIYPKRIASNNTPAKTSILITGEVSGATFEYDVTVTYNTGTGTGDVEDQ